MSARAISEKTCCKVNEMPLLGNQSSVASHLRKKYVDIYIYIYIYIYTHVGAKLQATNRVPRPVDRGTATRYGG